jgi:hypothetical protein
LVPVSSTKTSFALLMAAEAALSLALGRTLAEHLATHRTAFEIDRFMAQVVFALFPLFVARWTVEGRP